MVVLFLPISRLSSLVLIQIYSSDIEMKVEGCRFSPSGISRFILHAPASLPVLKCQVYSKNPSAKHFFSVQNIRSINQNLSRKHMLSGVVKLK